MQNEMELGEVCFVRPKIYMCVLPQVEMIGAFCFSDYYFVRCEHSEIVLMLLITVQMSQKSHFVSC